MNEERIVWFNGMLMPDDEVALSPFDLGVANGLGVFETLMAYEGSTPTFDRHYERLKTSAAVMDLAVPVAAELADAIQGVIKANELEDERARVRITLGTGSRPMQSSDDSCDIQDYIFITAVPQPERTDIAELILVPMRCNERSATSGLKSTSYANYLLAYRHARKEGADEAVMMNTMGQLCECSMANLFVVKDGCVFTPPLSSGCLPGVTRGLVMELCQREGIPVEEVELTEDVLFISEEIFITSSGREVQAAKMVDTSLTGPGPITQRLADAYRGIITQSA